MALTRHTEAKLNSLLIALDSDADGAISDEPWFTGYPTATSYYYPDPDEEDQGVTGSGGTIKSYVDTIGSDNAVIYLSNPNGSETTTYTFDTSETIPSNVILEIQNGAILARTTGDETLTLDSPENLIVGRRQKITSVDMVRFTDGGHVTPYWFGATGDGSTDDSGAFQLAVNCLPTGGEGGIIDVFGGVFHFDSEVDVGVDGLSIIGSGMRSDNSDTYFTADSNISFFDTNPGADELIFNFTLKNVTLKCTSTTRTVYDVVLDQSYHALIENVEIVGSAAAAQDQTYGIQITNSGSKVGQCNTILNCWLRDSSIVVDSTDNHIIGGWVWGHERNFGIHLTSSSSHTLISGVDVIPSSVYGGIYVEGEINRIAGGTHIDGSSVTTGIGIFLNDSAYNVITGVTLQNCYGGGIKLYESSFNTISSNVFEGNNRENNANNHDLLIEASAGTGCGYNTIIGNVFRNGDSTTTADAINQTNGGGGVGYNKYIGNIIQGTGYNDSAISGIVSTTFLSGNYGFVTANSGTAIITSGNTSVEVSHGLDVTPTAADISIVPSNSLGSATKYYVSDADSDSFDINVDVDPGATGAAFGWSVNKYDK